MANPGIHFMTVGIYRLIFDKYNRYYIGQSVNIEQRYKAHLQKLNNGTANVKMNHAYNTYGIPTLEILCECSKENLNIFEKEAFIIFDCIDNGLNIAREPEVYLEGTLNPASKYGKEQLILVLKLLGDELLPYQTIADMTGVDINSVRHIHNQEAHSWLRQEFPDMYEKMLKLKHSGIRIKNRNSAKHLGISYPILIDPSGSEYIVENVSSFAREYGLDSSTLVKVLNKKPSYKSHKGWKLKE